MAGRKTIDTHIATEKIVEASLRSMAESLQEVVNQMLARADELADAAL